MDDVRRQEKLQDAIGMVGDDLIAGARKKSLLKSISRRTMVLIAAVLVVVLVATNMIYQQRYFFVYGRYVVEAAEYPSLWGESDAKYQKRIGAYEESVGALNSFYKASISEFLSGIDGENVTYSPVNVSIALGMLAEITDGESRCQILETLGVDNIEILRQKINDIWKANYSKDSNTCVLANSIWLDNNVKYKKEPLKILADKYYASSFYGDMGSDAYTDAMRAWLNEQSDGLLEELNKELVVSPEAVVMLASTLNFEDDWKDEFKIENTKDGVFYGPSGEITCEFMSGSEMGRYYYGEQFVAASRPFKSGASMWFLLPDEDVSVDELLQNDEALEFIVNPDLDKGEKTEIYLKLPKYDISSKLNLIGGLKNLGIEDVFDYEGDFSTLLGDDGNYKVDKVEHSVRVIVDEDGAKAVAQTITGVKAEGVPIGANVILDRPFIFAITSEVGAPLFVGVVNQPN